MWSQGPDGNWKPTLVLLRINRAATCVKWSPFGEYPFEPFNIELNIFKLYCYYYFFVL